ncbi:MAG: sensor histidine kinase [Limisphaerales bacterium]
MNALIKKIESWPQGVAAVASILLVGIVGIGDYATGYEAGFFIFYLIPLALGTWRLNTAFGILLSLLSVITWWFSNLIAGEPYTPMIVVWNGTMLFILFVVVVLMVGFYKELENRVRERTSALTQEMAKRRRLEKELLEAGEREQRRIGHDLHDSLCQHLTGTALAGQVLEKKLADKSLAEAAAAGHLVNLVEEAIDLARSIARGLHPLEMQTMDIEDHFRDLAANITEQFKINCTFDCPQPVSLRDFDVITHLYRIAQEAITNAIRHGKARSINVCLDAADGELVLTVTDDGVGFPEKQTQSRDGIGLHIMAYRASMIGATVSIDKLPTQGSRVTCTLPGAAIAREAHDAKK